MAEERALDHHPARADRGGRERVGQERVGLAHVGGRVHRATEDHHRLGGHRPREVVEAVLDVGRPVGAGPIRGPHRSRAGDRDPGAHEQIHRERHLVEGVGALDDEHPLAAVGADLVDPRRDPRRVLE
jgi:hypothetical protein